LKEVSRQWTATGTNLGLPAFDWDAVTTLLSTVRAV
jgi:hypothetical protein